MEGFEDWSRARGCAYVGTRAQQYEVRVPGLFRGGDAVLGGKEVVDFCWRREYARWCSRIVAVGKAEKNNQARRREGAE